MSLVRPARTIIKMSGLIFGFALLTAFTRADDSDFLVSSSASAEKVDPALLFLILNRHEIKDDPFECPSPEEYSPSVFVPPIYPTRAANRGIEGYCTVEFTVTAAGEVLNPIAVDCEPSGIFERSSVSAAAQFEYRPCVVDGEPANVSGVSYTFTYQLQD